MKRRRLFTISLCAYFIDARNRNRPIEYKHNGCCSLVQQNWLNLRVKHTHICFADWSRMRVGSHFRLGCAMCGEKFFALRAIGESETNFHRMQKVYARSGRDVFLLGVFVVARAACWVLCCCYSILLVAVGLLFVLERVLPITTSTANVSVADIRAPIPVCTPPSLFFSSLSVLLLPGKHNNK